MKAEQVGVLDRIATVWGKDSPEYAAVAEMVDAAKELAEAHEAFDERGVAVKRSLVTRLRAALAGLAKVA